MRSRGCGELRIRGSGGGGGKFVEYPRDLPRRFGTFIVIGCLLYRGGALRQNRASSTSCVLQPRGAWRIEHDQDDMGRAR